MDRLESTIHWCKTITLIKYVICMSALIRHLTPLWAGLNVIVYVLFTRRHCPFNILQKCACEDTCTKINETTDFQIKDLGLAKAPPM